MREIALRSESFYEAQGRLRGLDGEIVTAVGRIRELREVVRVLTGDLVGAARQVQELNATRGNLVALQQKLTVILYVSQALTALKLVSAFTRQLVFPCILLVDQSNVVVWNTYLSLCHIFSWGMGYYKRENIKCSLTWNYNVVYLELVI